MSDPLPPAHHLLCALCIVERKKGALLGFPEVAVTYVRGTALCRRHVPSTIHLPDD